MKKGVLIGGGRFHAVAARHRTRRLVLMELEFRLERRKRRFRLRLDADAGQAVRRDLSLQQTQRPPIYVAISCAPTSSGWC